MARFLELGGVNFHRDDTVRRGWCTVASIVSGLTRAVASAFQAAFVNAVIQADREFVKLLQRLGVLALVLLAIAQELGRGWRTRFTRARAFILGAVGSGLIGGSLVDQEGHGFRRDVARLI